MCGRVGVARIRSAKFVKLLTEMTFATPFQLGLLQVSTLELAGGVYLADEECPKPTPKTGWRKFNVKHCNYKSANACYAMSFFASLSYLRAGNFLLRRVLLTKTLDANLRGFGGRLVPQRSWPIKSGIRSFAATPIAGTAI